MAVLLVAGMSKGEVKARSTQAILVKEDPCRARESHPEYTHMDPRFMHLAKSFPQWK